MLNHRKRIWSSLRNQVKVSQRLGFENELAAGREEGKMRMITNQDNVAALILRLIPKRFLAPDMNLKNEQNVRTITENKK